MKPFNNKLSFCSFLLAIWSFLVTFFAFVATFIVAILKNYVSLNGEIKILSLFTVYLLILNMLVLFSSPIVLRRDEEKFWLLYDSLEKIFKVEFKIDIFKNKFIK